MITPKFQSITTIFFQNFFSFNRLQLFYSSIFFLSLLSRDSLSKGINPSRPLFRICSPQSSESYALSPYLTKYSTLFTTFYQHIFPISNLINSHETLSILTSIFFIIHQFSPNIFSS